MQLRLFGLGRGASPNIEDRLINYRLTAGHRLTTAEPEPEPEPEPEHEPRPEPEPERNQGWPCPVLHCCVDALRLM